MSMQDQRLYSYRCFFLSFSAAFLVLSVLFLFLVVTVHPAGGTGSLPAAEPASEALPGYLPTADDALTVLFIGTETASADAGTFILARFNPVRGTVPVVVFPPQTLVRNREKTEPLSMVYRYGGADYARNALAGTLGIEIHRYVRMDVNAFVAGATAIGSVEYLLDRDMPLERGGMTITMREGHQLLDGQRVASIIRYRDHEGGEAERCRITGELTAAIVNQRMDVVESALMDKIFETLINLVDSDISYTDYDNRKDAALFLAQLAEEPAFSLPVEGEFREAGSEFALSDTFSARLHQAFA